MNQFIVLKNNDSVIKSFEIPYQIKVFYTLSTNSTSIIIRCGIGILDTYDNSIITDVFLKDIKDAIESNPCTSVEYKYDQKVIGSVKINSATYIAYKTKVNDNGILTEDLEITNSI